LKSHVSNVLRAHAVIGDKELVCGVNGEVHRQLGGGGRHRSNIVTLLGTGLPRQGLDLGWHGGVVVVVEGSIVGSGVAIGVNGVNLIGVLGVSVAFLFV
jgi:hypothetical protein